MKRKSEHSIYPTYFGQKINTEISIKSGFEIEEKYLQAWAQVLPSVDEYQKKFRVEISDGIFKNPNPLDGLYQFVLTCEDEPKLLCESSTALNHAFLSLGKNVLSAGALVFEKGRLIGIDNNSGHYRPTDDEMLPVIKALYKASQGTLKKYVSFCSPDWCGVYSVDDLWKAESFSNVYPIEMLSSLESMRRFGATLNQSRCDLYQGILDQDTPSLSFNRVAERNDLTVTSKVSDSGYYGFLPSDNGYDGFMPSDSHEVMEGATSTDGLTMLPPKARPVETQEALLTKNAFFSPVSNSNYYGFVPSDNGYDGFMRSEPSDNDNAIDEPPHTMIEKKF